jgi:hypothetical protein
MRHIIRMSDAQYEKLDAKLKELGADPDFGDAMNCDLISIKLGELVAAGFNLDAFLAKQTEFYSMRDEVLDLHHVFEATGGVII